MARLLKKTFFRDFISYKTTSGLVLRFSLISPHTDSAALARNLSLSSAKCFPSTGGGFHRATPLEKKILVWSKIYPKLSEVPDEVTQTQIRKAKDLLRIKISLAMMAVTMILSYFYIRSGRNLVLGGDNIKKRNEERHKEYEKENSG